MLAKTQALEIYAWMVLNRTLEDRMISLARAGRIPVRASVGRGQEALWVGAACSLQSGDWIAPMTRSPGALLVRGISVTEILAQAMGRRHTSGTGRENELGIGDLARGILAPTAMAGSVIPVLAGAGIASRMLKKSSVAMALADEVHANSTDFHEGLNLAAVQKAPLVVVLCANHPNLRTATELQTANPDFMARAGAYGAAGFECDGTDALAVYLTCSGAVAHARSGAGAAIVVAHTPKGLRVHTYAAAPPSPSQREARGHDPIRRLESSLEERGWLSLQERTEIRNQARAAVDSATASAEKSPLPSAESALGGAYHEKA